MEPGVRLAGCLGVAGAGAAITYLKLYYQVRDNSGNYFARLVFLVS